MTTAIDQPCPLWRPNMNKPRPQTETSRIKPRPPNRWLYFEIPLVCLVF